MPAILTDSMAETSITTNTVPPRTSHALARSAYSYVVDDQLDDLAILCEDATIIPTTADSETADNTPDSNKKSEDAQDCTLRNRTRRNILVSTGIATLAGALSSFSADTSAVKAQSPSVPPPPSMRKDRRIVGGAGLPAVPRAAVVALNRMAYGPRPGDIAAFNALGATEEARLAAYVAQQLEPNTIDDSACEAIVAAHGFATLNKSLTQLWADHIRAEDNPYSNRILPANETEQATFLRAVYSKRQLQQVLAEHWFNHFNIYGWDSWTAPVMVHYDRDVIRTHVLGNFRAMLGAVAKSPAMLYYLDNQSNSGGNPNENYARELFELHAMGAENYLGVVALIINADGSYTHPAPKDEKTGRPLLYVDADVYGATTCFTGWRINNDTGLFTFDDSAHFPYQKVVLGRLIPEAQGIRDGEEVLDLVAKHPGTARYLCRKLCRRLISDTPSEAIVEAAADVFMANVDAPDQLKKVTATILLSSEFRTTWAQKIKRPFEFAVSILRASEANFTPDSTFLRNYDSMGQPLFSWGPPNGYPDEKETWSSTMPLLQRWRFVHFLSEWQIGGEGEDKDLLRLRFATPTSVKTPNAIVAYWANRLLGIALPAEEHQHITAFLANGRNPDLDLPESQLAERISPTVALIFMSPSFQWR